MGKAQKTAKILAIANRKGGCAKTMTATSLAVGLARHGKRVLAIDADSQGSMSVSFGVSEPDKLTDTLATVMTRIVGETEFDPLTGVIRNSEGVDVLPANSNLSALEISLAGIIAPSWCGSRETILRQYIEKVKPLYDYIILDTAPTLDLLTINVLAAADTVIIPVTPKFLDALGLELLLKSVTQIRRHRVLGCPHFEKHPQLEIDGILLTMVDRRAKLTRNVIASIENAYGGKIKIFADSVPRSVRQSVCPEPPKFRQTVSAFSNTTCHRGSLPKAELRRHIPLS